MIEIYCDESRQDLLVSKNPSHNFALIGSLWMSEATRLKLTKQIQILRTQHDVWGEIKWSKVSQSKIEFYKSIIDLFLNTQNMPYFRCICIDSRKVDNGLFNGGDGELGFYKFYYQVLYHWIDKHPITCRVFCDVKENRVKDRLKTLYKVLQNTSNGTVTAVQALRSSDTPMLQICDLLLGMASARLNRSVSAGSAKYELITYFEKSIGSKISATCQSEHKFNVFCIKLRENK